MLPVRLSSRIDCLFRLATSRSGIRFLATSQIKLESETARLIKLRREREANEEQTSGFDKMARINLYHLNMMKKYDTPELNRKRDIHMFKMFIYISSFLVACCIFITLVYWSLLKLILQDLFPENSRYWIDGNPFDRFKERPLPLPKED